MNNTIKRNKNITIATIFRKVGLWVFRRSMQNQLQSSKFIYVGRISAEKHIEITMIGVTQRTCVTKAG